jgi:hypothetical protein
LTPFKREKGGSRESKEVFGSLQKGNGWLEGIKRSLWFPSKGKGWLDGNQKESLVPFKRKNDGSRESKEVPSFIQSEKSNIMSRCSMSNKFKIF